MLFYFTDKSYIDVINKKKVAVWINTVLLTSRFLVFTNVMLNTISSKTYFALMDKLGLLVNSSLTQKCRTCTVRQLGKITYNALNWNDKCTSNTWKSIAYQQQNLLTDFGFLLQKYIYTYDIYWENLENQV